MRRKILIAAALLAALVGTTACGSSSPTSSLPSATELAKQIKPDMQKQVVLQDESAKVQDVSCAVNKETARCIAHVATDSVTEDSTGRETTTLGVTVTASQDGGYLWETS